MARILIVDDESSMRFLLRVALESAGHEVVEAANGRAALQLIEEGWIPDLVATDFMMPRMNGGELIDELRANPATRDVPVIMVSASPGAERRSRPDAFLQKPFDPGTIISCASGLLERARE